MVTKDLGMVTAYAYAVAGGYTGTEEQFTQLMADLAVVVDDFDNFSVNVTTLPAGSSATASYADGVLSLGIPKGDTGATGATGETGAPAGFGTVSATVDANIGTPSVEVTASGADTAKNFAFAFHNLKGEKGDKGDTGEVSEAELTQAFEDFSENGTVANAEQLTTDIRANDQTPYLFRTSGGSVDIGDREYINGIVGGTVAWNQLLDGLQNFANTETDTRTALQLMIKRGVGTSSPSVMANTYTGTGQRSTIFNNTESGTGLYMYHNGSTRNIEMKLVSGFTWNANHKYMLDFYLTSNDPTTVGGLAIKNFMLIDLTQMFGSTIADYIYSLEQANAGAGVAFFRSLFPKPYYAYNAGELMSVRGLVSHDMVGFNAWDEEWESGEYSISTGAKITGSNGVRCKNLIPIIGGANYTFTCLSKAYANAVGWCWYDSNGEYISGDANAIVSLVAPSDAKYLSFFVPSSWYGTTYNHDICINLAWDNSRNGEYEAYQKWSYPLDSGLELRGIPKLDASNNLYYDGDAYESDGTVTRKYGVVDLGTLTWSYSSPYFTAYLTDFKDNANGSTIVQPNARCSKYSATTLLNMYNGEEKTIGLGTASNYAGRVIVRDSTYSDATAFKTAMSGVYLVYELATPTTENADPYTSPQIVNDFGTEEFVIDNTINVPIPVGHNTDYPVNLKAKVEMMPNSPEGGNGDYIVRQTNGTNEYVALANNATIQNILSRLEALEG